MGSYLQIDGHEINTKTTSGILIDAIRQLDNLIMSNFNSTKKERRYFSPENYAEIAGVISGCGDWRIHRKGIARLVEYFDLLRDNPSHIRELAENEYYTFYKNGSVDPETKINEIHKQMEQTVNWCFNYLANILAEMVIEGKKYVDAEWV